jgi:hypothetical protein
MFTFQIQNTHVSDGDEITNVNSNIFMTKEVLWHKISFIRAIQNDI